MNNATSSLSALKTYSFLMEGLGVKERLYVEARAMGSVPVVAARSAGFSESDAKIYRLETDPAIRMAVESAIRIHVHDRTVTRDDVRSGLLDAVRMSANSTELRAAWRELGLLEGHYEPKKVEVKGSMEEIQRAILGSSDDDLAKLAALPGEFTVLDFVAPKAKEKVSAKVKP